MAKDSRLLAEASKRDSASMKFLTLVSVFYLPGMFVSSLFSIPLFDWDDGKAVVRAETWGPRLGVYLIVLVPIMIGTVAIWGFWMMVQRGKGKGGKWIVVGGEKEGEEDGAQDGNVRTEVGVLAHKRRSSEGGGSEVVNSKDVAVG